MKSANPPNKIMNTETTNYKTTVYTPTDNAQQAAKHFTALELKIQKLKIKLQKEATQRKEEIESCKNEQAIHTDTLKQYANANRDELFDDKKSATVFGVSISFRNYPEKIVFPTDRAQNLQIIKHLQNEYPQFILKTENLSAAAILKEKDDAVLMNTLSAMGVKRMPSTEEFCVKLSR